MRWTDTHAADILDALDRREKEDEDWLVMIVSDHGGGGGQVATDHCIKAENNTRTIMFVRGEEVIEGEMLNQPAVVDTTAMVLHHMGIMREGLDGRTTAFRQEVDPYRKATCKSV